MTNTFSNSHTETVCIVSPEPPPYGGMSLQAQKLAVHLREEGLTVTLLPTNPEFPGIMRYAEKVPGLRTIVRLLTYIRLLIRTLPSVSVIHHFSACGLFFFFGTVPLMVMGRLQRKRIVLNYRGGRAPAFLKKWAWFVIPIMRKADSVIVPSAFLQRVFAEHGLSASVVPNIVQTGYFPYRERKEFRPILLVTRHLEPLYNIECLLRAFRIVVERFPKARLSIGGVGYEEERLRSLCHKWNLAGVSFCGHVSMENLPELYASHDIYVNSSNADNFPGALVEAACSGLPIVTTRAGGIPDMISDRESGLLVSLNDHEALAAGIIELVENPKLGRRLAETARCWAEQFSWDGTFRSLMKHYGLNAAGSATRETAGQFVPSGQELIENSSRKLN